MRLWRLTRAPFVALDGAGPEQHGARYTSLGRPVVNFASEPGLAVLVALRYLPRDLAGIDEDYVLGWTDVDATAERVPVEQDDDVTRQLVDNWLDSRRSLLAAVSSKVLPEADIVMMNPLHPDAAGVKPLVTRPFSFSECLHTPPMLERYGNRK
ncbi:MAG: RES family NAD+ phosphorylase [Novosphingobium sp.]|nr:RES family NAD+ phosphorylase [Novosphingobium sp.]MCP5402733.1 RES family NAD+ phosphorylase [Novosphingobium sp.]